MKLLKSLKKIFFLSLTISSVIATSCSDGNYSLDSKGGAGVEEEGPDAFGRMPGDPLYGADENDNMPDDPLFEKDDCGRSPDDPLYGADENDNMPDDPHYKMEMDAYGHYKDDPDFLDETKYRYAMRWQVNAGTATSNAYNEMLNVPLEENKIYRLKGKIGNTDVTGKTIVLSKNAQNNQKLTTISVSKTYNDPQYSYDSSGNKNQHDNYKSEDVSYDIYMDNITYNINIGSGSTFFTGSKGNCYYIDFRNNKQTAIGDSSHTSAGREANQQLQQLRSVYANNGTVTQKVDCYILSDEEFGKKEDTGD